MVSNKHIFGSIRIGYSQKLNSACVFASLYIITTSLLILDRIFFNSLKVSGRLDDLSTLLSSCTGKNDDLDESVAIKVYERIMQITGRLMISTVFFLVLSRMRRVWFRARDSLVGRTYINLSNQRDIVTISKFLEGLTMFLVFVHILSFIGPVVGDSLSVKILGRRGVDNFLNEAIGKGTECDQFILLGDDIGRIIYFFIILVPLFYLSRRLMTNEGEASFTYTFGQSIYEVFLFLLVIELLRHGDYPTAIFLILPVSLLTLFEMFLIPKLFHTEIQMKSYKISDKFMLFYWRGRTVEKKHSEFDSVSRMYRIKLNQYQLQLPFDLVQDLGGEYGSRYCLGFNNVGNMFSLGLYDTLADETLKKEKFVPFTRRRLLEVEEGVLKLNIDNMNRVRKRQKAIRKRNQTLITQLNLVQKQHPRSKNVLSSFIEHVNNAGNVLANGRVGSLNQSSVDDDSVELNHAQEEYNRQDEVENRDLDVTGEDLEKVLYNVSPVQEFDHAIMLKLEPIWDSEERSSRAPFSFGEVATIEQLNDYTNPVRCNLYGSFGAGEIDYFLNEGRDVILIGSGGAAICLLDSIRYIIHHDLKQSRLNILFSTADLYLLQWFIEAVDDLFYSSPREMRNLKIIAALTTGELALHNVGRIAVSSAYNFGNGQNSNSPYHGSGIEQQGRDIEELPVNYRTPFEQGARRIFDKVKPVSKPRFVKQSGAVPHNSRLSPSANVRVRSSNRRTAIRFRWGKVVLGRINVFEKFKKLKKIGFECKVFYQGGSKEFERDIVRASKSVGFWYQGLHSYEAIQSMTPENPALMKIVTAMESMVRGSYKNYRTAHSRASDDEGAVAHPTL